LDVYASGRIALGKTLLRAELWEEARKEFEAAVSLGGDTSLTEALEMAGLTYLYFKECDKAIVAFGEAKRRSLAVSPVHLKMESIAYGECKGDEERAREFFSEYEKQKREAEQPLETL
jgi:tetratricopeptide (TPR) repeat protein